MADVPNKMYWMGQPIDDLPRDELIQIISDLAGQLADHYTPGAIRARALGSVDMIKRGEVKDTRAPL